MGLIHSNGANEIPWFLLITQPVNVFNLEQVVIDDSGIVNRGSHPLGKLRRIPPLKQLSNTVDASILGELSAGAHNHPGELIMRLKT